MSSQQTSIKSGQTIVFGHRFRPSATHFPLHHLIDPWGGQSPSSLLLRRQPRGDVGIFTTLYQRKVAQNGVGGLPDDWVFAGMTGYHDQGADPLLSCIRCSFLIAQAVDIARGVAGDDGHAVRRHGHARYGGLQQNAGHHFPMRPIPYTEPAMR